MKKLSLLFLLLIWALPVPAKDSSLEELKKEIQALSESVKAMQKDLLEIKALLQSRMPAPPPANVQLDLRNHPFRGDRTAKLTVIEFSDYQ